MYKRTVFVSLSSLLLNTLKAKKEQEKTPQKTKQTERDLMDLNNFITN